MKHAKLGSWRLTLPVPWVPWVKVLSFFPGVLVPRESRGVGSTPNFGVFGPQSPPFQPDAGELPRVSVASPGRNPGLLFWGAVPSGAAGLVVRSGGLGSRRGGNGVGDEVQRTGIITAMPEELAGVLEALEPEGPAIAWGRRAYHAGRLGGQPVVCAAARIGKVAAAATATEMIVRFGIERLVVTGLAGGLSDALAVGDVVVATGLVQHDLDASPLFPAREVPMLGVTRLAADPGLVDALAAAGEAFCADARLGAERPRVWRGLVATGDRFVATTPSRAAVLEAVPEALCVEMEGAAVAQVAYEYGVRFGVVRTISDAAGAGAEELFGQSLGTLAGAWTVGILGALFGPPRGGTGAG